ncbi:MAG: hypothetical protein HYT31_04755 [Parcubacteria group bacterium]|nr:hypothetical protein [Parcubacteria group bacterium]
MAFCASGGGTTFQAIMQAIASGRIVNIEPRLLLVDRPCGACDKARELGMAAQDIVMLRRKDYPSHRAYGEAIIESFHARDIAWYGQYGWLQLTPPDVVRLYSGNNQHPAPHWFGGKGMYGKRPHAAVLEFRRLLAERGGRMVNHTLVISQRVHEKFDRGEVIRCGMVPIHDGDTPETLQARALPIEWEVQIETLQILSLRCRLWRSERYYAEPFVRPGEEGLVGQANAPALKINP